jgi:hypothetical protein
MLRMLDERTRSVICAEEINHSIGRGIFTCAEGRRYGKGEAQEEDEVDLVDELAHCDIWRLLFHPQITKLRLSHQAPSLHIG